MHSAERILQHYWQELVPVTQQGMHRVRSSAQVSLASMDAGEAVEHVQARMYTFFSKSKQTRNRPGVS